MDKPDICFLQYDLRGGGAERKVCTLANYFVSRGKTVDIGLFGKNTVAYAVDPRVNVTYIRRDSFEYRNCGKNRFYQRGNNFDKHFDICATVNFGCIKQFF